MIRHPLARTVVFTDTLHAFAEENGCYWLIDAIASHILANPKFNKANERFKAMSFWVLKPDGDGGAVLSAVEDSGMRPVIVQKIEFTDFPFQKGEEVRLWVQMGQDSETSPPYWCIMLPEDY